MTLRGAIVLGASRSGTSLATGLLAAAGFYAGAETDLMVANSANPAGYWENMGLFSLNEDLLAALDGSWFAPPSGDAQLATAEQAAGRIRRLLARLSEQAGEAPLVIKDPRIGTLINLWAPEIENLLHPVLTVRHPVEIAFSLAARDGTPTAFAQAHWELHTLRLLGHLHGRAATIVRYEDMLAVPGAATAFVSAVADQLDPELRGHVDGHAARDVIRTELRHHDARALDSAAHLTVRQSELWRFLASLPAGTQIVRVPSPLLSASRVALREAGGSLELIRAEDDRVRLIQTHRDELGQLEEHARTLAATTEEWRDRAERAEEVAASANRRLAGLVTSRSWRLTAPLRAIARILRRARSSGARPVPVPHIDH